MVRALRFLASLALALWLGSMFTMSFFVAPSIFANESGVVPDTSAAGDVMSPLLARMDRMGFVAPLVAAAALVGLRVLRAGGRAPVVGIALLLAAWGGGLYSGTAVTGEIRTIRAELKAEFGGVHAAPSDHPSRRRFGALHGVSMMIVLANMALGLGAFFCAAAAIDPPARAERDPDSGAPTPA